MKKLPLIACLLFTTQLVTAQIELNEENFSTVNAKERMSSAAIATEVDLNTGEGYFWDFSDLTPTNQTLEEYNPVSDLGSIAGFQFGNFAPDKYKATYYILNPDVPLSALPSFLPIQFSDYNNLMRLSEDSLSLVGVSVTINGQTLPIRYSEIETQYYFPVKYGDQYTTRGRFDQDMNPMVDAQWRQKRQHDVHVDGWGKVFTPMGSFDCLRVKHTIVEQDSIYASINGFGMWVPLNVPKQIVYEWRTTSEGSPLVRIKANLQGTNENVTSIEYRDDAVFVGLDELGNDISLSVYPNPVFNAMHVNTNTSFEKYTILSVDGKTVQSGVFTASIDCSQLGSGAYLLRLSGKNNVVSKAFVKQ